MRCLFGKFAVLAALLASTAVSGLCAEREIGAEAILARSGVEGGLVVHVGCADGRLTAEFCQSSRYLVDGLARSAEQIAGARELIRTADLPGVATVRLLPENELPYVNESVNLVYVDCPFRAGAEEILRVLCPNGCALVREEGNREWLEKVELPKQPSPDGFVLFRKPLSPDTDSWTHFLHGPDGHVMSEDTVVGPPYHIQWLGDPVHSRSHGRLTSMNVMVSGGERLFYIIDESPTKLPQLLPGRWALVSRDAHNGVVLWRRDLKEWQPYFVKDRNSFPADLHRRLVASDDEVFATLSIHGPVSALDAATGRTLRTYKGTEKTEDIIHENGVLYLSINTGSEKEINRREMSYRHVEPRQKRVVALDAASGKRLWTCESEDTNELMPMTLAVKDNRVFFQNSRNVVCLDKATGKVNWRAPRPSEYFRPGWSSPTLSAIGDVVVSADRQTGPKQKIGKDNYASGGFSTGNLVVFSAETGKKLWDMASAEGCRAPTDVFSVGGELWFGQSLQRMIDYQKSYDLNCGQLARTFPEFADWPDMHHHRCYRDKATTKYILAGRTGVEFIDLKTGELFAHNWIRGNCKFGVLPANGLLYLPPEQCGCYIESKLTGFHALAPKRPAEIARADSHPHVRGPAFDRTDEPNKKRGGERDDWPTFRGDSARSGKASTLLGGKLKKSWETLVGGRLSQAVVTGGRLFVASIDTDTLHALSSDSGKPLWQFQAGGRIDSPPTLTDGKAIFGCRDGWVYALRCSDGSLAWKFRAAPDNRMQVCSGRLESVWPVHGSLLLRGSEVFFAAGRSSYVDGGVRMGRLDVRTGRLIAEKKFYSRDPESGRQINLYEPFKSEKAYEQTSEKMEMPGVLPDVLSSVGEEIWMRSVTFDASLNIKKGFPAHLFSSMGFLDDAGWEHSYWVYGPHMYGFRSGVSYAAKIYPSARIMVCDDEEVFGYQDGYEPITTPCFAAWDKTREPEKIKKGKKSNWQINSKWSREIPLQAEALLISGDNLFMAGSPPVDREKATEFLNEMKVDRYDLDPFFQKTADTLEGGRGGILYVVKKTDGSEVARINLKSIPVFDGMIAAEKRLFLSLKDGRVKCFK